MAADDRIVEPSDVTAHLVRDEAEGMIGRVTLWGRVARGLRCRCVVAEGMLEEARKELNEET